MPYPHFLRQFANGEHLEWVNGDVIPMPAVTDLHDDVFGFLYTLLKVFSERHDSGRVLSDPFQMKTGPSLPGRAPDIQFVSKRRLNRVRRLFTDGPADLVVEIISAASRDLDRGKKYAEYETGGVKEYWIIDPELQVADFYRRGRDRKFHQIEPDEDGVFESRVLAGLWLKVDWLWEPPALLVVLKEWGII
jgi:Uma2 family endonuclease